MINAGFNPLQQISAKTGKSISQLKEEMSKGAISAEMVQQAFLDATAAGGKFYNMSENASKTINGQISMMQDAMDAMFNDIGTKAEGIIIKGVQTATALIQNYETIGKVIVGLVSTYGIYRTAVLLATTAEEGKTIATLANAKATALAEKAQKALNSAMLTNPFVAFTAVLAGVTAAIIAYETSTNSARKSQDALKEALKESDEASTGELRTLAQLKGELAACEEGTEKYNTVKEKIISGYSKYHSNLAQEIEEVGLLDSTYKKLTESITSAFSARQYDKFIKEQETSLDKTLAKNYDNIYDRLKKDLGDEKGTEVYTKLRDALMMGNEVDENTQKIIDSVQKKGKLTADSRLDMWITNIRNEMENFEKISNDARVKFGVKDGEKEAEGSKGQTKTTTFLEDYKLAEKEWKDAKKALEAIENDKKSFTKKQYEDAKTLLESKEAAFKKLGGDTTGKEENAEVKKANEQQAAQAKVDALNRKQEAERVRSAKDMEFTVEQARIDAMKEGYTKVKAQRELNNKKELENLERQKQDYITKAVESEKAIFEAEQEQKAKNEKNYKKQAFDANAARKRIAETDPVVKQYETVVEYTQKKQSQDATKEDMADWRESMNAYLKEYGDYEGKKLAITQEYEVKIAEASNLWEKASLSQKMKEELAALDIEVNKTTNAIAQLFGDMRDKTVGELEGIAADGTSALEFLKEGVWDEEIGKSLGISKETFEVWSQSPEKLKAIADALEGVRTSAEQLRNPIDKIIEGFKDLFNTASDSNKFNKAFAAISEGVGEISSAISFVSESIASVADATGNEGLGKVSKGIDGALNVLDETMSGAKIGSAFGPWGAAIGAVAGLATSLVTELSKAKDAMHQMEIDNLAKDNEALEESYDSLGKSIQKAFSADASKLIEQQNKLLEQKKANLRLMIAEEQAKKNVDEGQVDAWLKQIDEIDEAIQDNKESAVEALTGQDVMSAIDSFASAYADAWENGTDAAEASSKAVRNMLRTSLIEFLKGELSTEVEEFNKKLAEAMMDGIIEPWEEIQLDELRKKMDEEAENYYEQTSKFWEGDKSTSQQEASRKGYQNLSEDTGNELVGRATAQYESNLRIEDAVRHTVNIAEGMSAAQLQIRDIAAESRALIADSYLELQQIRENTGESAKTLKKINERITAWDDKIKSL